MRTCPACEGSGEHREEVDKKAPDCPVPNEIKTGDADGIVHINAAGRPKWGQ